MARYSLYVLKVPLNANQPHFNNSNTASFCAWGHCTNGWECQCQEDVDYIHTGRTSETSWMSSDYVDIARDDLKLDKNEIDW